VVRRGDDHGVDIRARQDLGVVAVTRARATQFQRAIEVAL